MKKEDDDIGRMDLRKNWILVGSMLGWTAGFIAIKYTFTEVPDLDALILSSWIGIAFAFLVLVILVLPSPRKKKSHK